MALLHVALQEGFTGEPVTVHVNGKESLRHASVRTRLQTGYADSFEVEVPEGKTTIEIRLPGRSTSKRIEVDVRNRLYVGFSVGPGGEIAHQTADQPFGYL